MRNSRHSDPARDRRPLRVPNFDSGVIPEPLISFGGRHEHVDPKTGLSLYGPHSLPGQKGPVLTSIVVGIVGPPVMVADAEQWLEACKGVLTNDGSEPFTRPHFPGFGLDSPFRCDLIFGDTWRETIKPSQIVSAVAETNFYARIKSVVRLYIQAIEILAGREPRPSVILCCMPQDVVDHCTVQKTRSGEVRRTKISKAEKKAVEDVRRGARFLFGDMDPTLGVEEQEQGHQNLRRGLKAEAMRVGVPTQLVWPRTLCVNDVGPTPGERRLQDVATRAWNFTTAMYHKAGGSPWRMDGISDDVCFIGISFYKEVQEANPRIRTSMAQAFTAAGDGYVLRGNSFEWIRSSRERSPHLDEKSAAALIRDVLALYERQNRGRLPGRIVVHKTSRFWEEELAGFEVACRPVPQRDFVAFGRRGLQFYRPGNYPPLRGTFVKFSDTDLALYTVGYIPYLRTYPGARVPMPLEIVEHFGDSPWNVVLQEILALTKMNWNTADFACSEPITTAFSQKVGQILAELPPNSPIRHEYRYYM